MPRRKPRPSRSKQSAPRPLADVFGRTESGPGDPDDVYIVRTIPGSRAVKTYRCPGCDHEIRPGTAHIVAWAAEDHGGADRRHWHQGCWKGRRTRGITRRWS